MFLLVPSPLLGPATWRGVERWLSQQAHEAQTVDLGARSRTPDGVLTAVAAAAGDREVVLVPHSNAGLYAPHLATLVDVRATVYVDAALPGPASEEETPLAPPAFLDLLRTLADEDGVLPPWTQWWDDVADLFPDEATRAAIEAEQQRLPLDYFTSLVPTPRDWRERGAAYLAFGDTYAEERDLAIRAGWPTRTIAGGHLHQLHDPAGVGRAIVDLAEELEHPAP
ncbi:hypothetical protein [Nocardioides sp.]|uniref:hypothetical protein n=1 Tax=Nocardioides sp. TaxID=35761 RepID=UPI00286C25B9|nr:hypothetical protein [Nocardioides sp.]